MHTNRMYRPRRAAGRLIKAQTDRLPATQCGAACRTQAVHRTTVTYMYPRCLPPRRTQYALHFHTQAACRSNKSSVSPVLTSHRSPRRVYGSLLRSTYIGHTGHVPTHGCKQFAVDAKNVRTACALSSNRPRLHRPPHQHSTGKADIFTPLLNKPQLIHPSYCNQRSSVRRMSTRTYTTPAGSSHRRCARCCKTTHPWLPCWSRRAHQVVPHCVPAGPEGQTSAAFATARAG